MRLWTTATLLGAVTALGGLPISACAAPGNTSARPATPAPRRRAASPLRRPRTVPIFRPLPNVPELKWCSVYLRVVTCYVNRQPTAARGFTIAAFSKAAKDWRKKAVRKYVGESCKTGLEAWSHTLSNTLRYKVCFRGVKLPKFVRDASAEKHFAGNAGEKLVCENCGDTALAWIVRHVRYPAQITEIRLNNQITDSGLPSVPTWVRQRHETKLL